MEKTDKQDSKTLIGRISKNVRMSIEDLKSKPDNETDELLSKLKLSIHKSLGKSQDQNGLLW